MTASQNITVETYLNDELESERSVSLRSEDARDWLKRHVLWAVHNGRSVDITPENKPEQKEVTHA